MNESGTRRNTLRRKLLLFCLVFFPFFFLYLAITIWRDTHRFVVRNYVLRSPKIKKDLRAVVLADLHGMEYGAGNQELVRAIDDQHPDLILVAGDLTTAHHQVEKVDFSIALTLLNRLRKKYPVYYINGNHESRIKVRRDIYGNVYRDYLKKLHKIGVKVLSSDSADLPEFHIRITGLSLSERYFVLFRKPRLSPKHLTRLLGKPDPKVFQILLAHNPKYFEAYADWGSDLTLSGHVHGGIIRLPYLGGVVSPAATLFPKYDGGAFHIGSRTMIVSRGLGTHTIPVRLWNPAELVVIDLKRDRK